MKWDAFWERSPRRWSRRSVQQRNLQLTEKAPVQVKSRYRHRIFRPVYFLQADRSPASPRTVRAAFRNKGKTYYGPAPAYRILCKILLLDPPILYTRNYFIIGNTAMSTKKEVPRNIVRPPLVILSGSDFHGDIPGSPNGRADIADLFTVSQKMDIFRCIHQRSCMITNGHDDIVRRKGDLPGIL